MAPKSTATISSAETWYLPSQGSAGFQLVLIFPIWDELGMMNRPFFLGYF